MDLKNKDDLISKIRNLESFYNPRINPYSSFLDLSIISSNNISVYIPIGIVSGIFLEYDKKNLCLGYSFLKSGIILKDEVISDLGLEGEVYSTYVPPSEDLKLVFPSLRV